jgi:hypothetical protein
VSVLRAIHLLRNPDLHEVVLLVRVTLDRAKLLNTRRIRSPAGIAPSDLWPKEHERVGLRRSSVRFWSWRFALELDRHRRLRASFSQKAKLPFAAEC